MCLAYLRWAYPPPPHHPERPRWYPNEDGLNFQGIDAPTPISQIPKVEKLNNLAINVFCWDKGTIVYRLSTQPEGMPRINLLLIEKAGKFHSLHMDERPKPPSPRPKQVQGEQALPRALPYTRQDVLEAHRSDCRGIGQTAVRVELSEEGKNKVFFPNHHEQLPVSFIIYTDCEALTTKVEGPELDPAKSNTQRTQHYEACSYCYSVVRCDRPVEYRGPNAAEHLLKSLQEKEIKIKGVLAGPKAMKMTRED